MSVLNEMSYYDGFSKAFGFNTADEAGIKLIRACAQNGTTKGRLMELYNNNNINKRTATFSNVMKILGYIPVIGFFTGLFNLYVGLSTLSSRNSPVVNPKSVSKGMILRGVAEICGIGVVCIVGDIYVTYKQRQNPISAESVIACGTEYRDNSLKGNAPYNRSSYVVI